MAEERASGLILRVRPFGETSLIVHWLTAEQGRVSTMAKGARRGKSNLAGMLDLAFAGELSFLRARRSTLHTLKEFVVQERHPGVRADYSKLLQFAYGVAFLERATETDSPVPEIYEAIRSWLLHLERNAAQPRTVYALEIKLLAVGGFDPSEGTESLSPETSELVEQLLTSPWTAIPELTAGKTAVAQLNRHLQHRVTDALGKLPLGRDEALSGSGVVAARG